MLNAWMKTVLIFACATISCPVYGQSQVQGGTNQASPQQQNRQYSTPRLTPEQIAAQKRAAQESREQQQRAQQAYAIQTGALNPAQVSNPQRIIRWIGRERIRRDRGFRTGVDNVGDNRSGRSRIGGGNENRALTVGTLEGLAKPLLLYLVRVTAITLNKEQSGRLWLCFRNGQKRAAIWAIPLLTSVFLGYLELASTVTSDLNHSLGPQTQ